MNEREWKLLKQTAGEARHNAYVPYSRFAVGAAVRTASGRLFQGCNIENASFGATLCAERVAMAAAVTAGERKLAGLVIVTGAEQPTPPCGICRQCLAELAPELQIRSYTEREEAHYSLDALLPEAFDSSQLDPRS